MKGKMQARSRCAPATRHGTVSISVGQASTNKGASSAHALLTPPMLMPAGPRARAAAPAS